MSDPGVSLALPVGMSSTTESEECSGQDSVVNWFSCCYLPACLFQKFTFKLEKSRKWLDFAQIGRGRDRFSSPPCFAL